jgi:hypothetical protein
MARAAGYLVPESKDARHVQALHMRDPFDREMNDLVLARDTTVRLNDKATYRQEPLTGKRPIIWKSEHRLSLSVNTWDRWDDSEPRQRFYQRHLLVGNLDSSRADSEHLCQLPDTFRLHGPGAEAHIAADADAVAAVHAERDLKQRTEARRKASVDEASAFGEQLVAILKTLDVEASSRDGTCFPGDRREASDFTIRMDLATAARVAEALGGTVARPPAKPMPLWKVWYGDTKEEDDKPRYVAARTRAGVVSHMLANYCAERRPNPEPNVPLDPARLIIEDAGPDPEVPANNSDEDAA